MKRLALVLAGLAAVVCIYVVAPARAPQAADHNDSDAVSANDGEADLLDLYAFTNGMASKVSLIMTFATGAEPGDTFDTTTDYVFNLTSSGGSGDPVSYTITCAFSGAVAPQTVTCVLSDGATDSATASGLVGDDICGSGVTSGGCSEVLRVTADVFDDPFFFNATGFTNTVAAVRDAAPSLEFAETGCPAVDGATAAALVDCLGSDCAEVGGDNGTASDAFAGNNVKALVLQVRKDAIDAGGDQLAVWASTEVAGDQIDRAGRPAISTALVGTFESDATSRANLKDQYNAAEDRSEWPAEFADDIAFSLGILDSLNSTAE